MKKIRIEEIGKYENEEVELRGWLYNQRSSGGIQFLIVRDGTGFLQVVVSKKEVGEEVFRMCKHIPQESAIILQGKVHKEERAPLGYEVWLKGVKIIHKALSYPISKKSHGVDFLLSRRHLWLRSRRPYAIMKIRDEVIWAITQFFKEKGFIRLDAPLFTPSSCEGTTTLFEVPYFGTKVYLSQSGQLYAEAGCMAFGKVYTFGPTFRAELSKTRRHLTEFWQIEPEIAFATLKDIMELAEEFVSYIVKRVVKYREKELKMLNRDIDKLRKITPPFPRLSYTEALNLLSNQSEVPSLSWGEDFGAPQESYISKQFDLPVIVHRYPAKCKAFYMRRDKEKPELALCMDVFAPEGYGEIIGGGEREVDFTILEERIREFKLKKENHLWYLDLRKYGTVEHAGFGLGLERLIAWICKLDHVREAIPFPRTIDRAYP